MTAVNVLDKKDTRLIFSLIEMRELEALLVKETREAANRTDIPQAKETFNRWADESEIHYKTLQKEIQKYSKTTPITECAGCIESGFKGSYSREQLHELIELEEGGLGMMELYSLAKKHLIIEGKAESRYTHIAEMTDDKKLKEALTVISEDETRHYREAKQLVDVIEKNYGNQIKNVD